jgi:hypothetical protein
VVGIF